MEIIANIADKLIWPMVVLILGIVFFFLTKDRLSLVQVDPNRRKIRMEFGKKLHRARQKVKNIEKTVMANGAPPASERLAQLGDQRAREAVIEAWGALKQTIFDAAAAFGIRLTPSTRITSVVNQMVALQVLDGDAAGLISLLDELGQELIDDRSLVPNTDDARGYIALVEVIVDWVMLELISAPRAVEQPVDTPSHHLKTVVGGYFTPPSAQQPTANLIGIRGPVNASSVPIHTTKLTIGSNADNALQIEGDGYVSGHHACIQFDQGSLFISDLNSRNGTFLNEERVDNTLSLLQPGDQIRLGKSIFQLDPTGDLAEGSVKTPASKKTKIY